MAGAIDDQAALRLAIEKTWEQLAAIIAEARGLEIKARQDPALLDDPWVTAHTRFVIVFADELRAAQDVYEALSHGVKLPADQLAPAYAAEKRLLEIITAAREENARPAPAPAVASATA